MAKKTVFYHVRRPMGYLGKQLDFGQLIKLEGARNDDKLVSMAYVAEWDGDIKDAVECSSCGEKFISGNTRIAHHKKRHTKMTEQEEDELLEKEDRRLTRDAPLNITPVKA